MTHEEALLIAWALLVISAIAGALVFAAAVRFFNPWVGRRRR